MEKDEKNYYYCSEVTCNSKKLIRKRKVNITQISVRNIRVENFHNKLSKNQKITQELDPKLTTDLHPIETKIRGKGVRKIRKSKSKKSKQKSEKIKLRIFNFVQLTNLMKICNTTRGTKSNV